MYCDRCGTQLTAGGQYCTNCGKAIVGSSAATGRGVGQASVSTGVQGGPGGAYGVAAGTDGRVRRNLRTLATLWMINGILRLAWSGSMIIFGCVFFPFLRGWRGPGTWPLGGWGVDGFLSRGSALGIYTLWGLLPEESGTEYDRLAEGDGQWNSAAASS